MTALGAQVASIEKWFLKGHIVSSFFVVIAIVLIAALLLGCAIGSFAGRLAGVLTFVGILMALAAIFLMIAHIDITIVNVLRALLHPSTSI